MLSSVPVEQIQAVEQVDKGTFQHPHVLQVVAQDDTGQLHTTYLQCKVGDPTLPQHPKNPRNPPPQPPSPAPSHGDRHGTMGRIPNPAVARHLLYWEHWGQGANWGYWGSWGVPPWLYWGHRGTSPVYTGNTGMPWLLQHHLPSLPPGQLCHQTVPPVPQPWCPSLPPPSSSSSPALAAPSPGCPRVPSGVPLSLLSPQSAPELWQWLWALRRATSANRDMLPTCHPGTFRAHRWTCCLQPTRAGRSEGSPGLGVP